MAKSDVEYDTDTISLTSTVQSEQRDDKVYDVEGILSEGSCADRDGNRVMKYLVQWTGYKVHR
jgi:hypothetical protein